MCSNVWMHCVNGPEVSCGVAIHMLSPWITGDNTCYMASMMPLDDVHHGHSIVPLATSHHL